MFDIAKVGSEPIVEVSAAECRLHRFQQKYTIHYERMSARITEQGEEYSCPIILCTDCPNGSCNCTRLIMAKHISNPLKLEEKRLTKLDYQSTI